MERPIATGLSLLARQKGRAMKKHLVIATIATSLLACGSAPAQVGGMATSPLGATSPLVMDGSAPVGPIGIPLGSTEMAAPGISPAERTAVIGLIDKLHASTAWQNALKQNKWDDFYKSGDTATAFFTSESARIKAVLTEAGVGS